MCLTSDPKLAMRMRVLRDHGMRPERRYWHEEAGFNFRMTNPQAAIGCAQLDRFQELLGRRAAVHDLYVKTMETGPEFQFPPPLPERYKPVVWFSCAVVPASQRAQLIAACKEANIDLRPFFNALSIMPAYQQYAGACPVSHALSLSGVNLPTSRRVDEQIAATISQIFKSVRDDSSLRVAAE